MVDGKFKFPEWQTPLEELTRGLEGKKLQEQIQKVEHIIFERLQVIGEGSEGRSERAAIARALSILRIIKHDKLGFPDWK